MTHTRILLTIVLLAAALALPTVATAQCDPFGFGLYFRDLTIGAGANVSHFPNHVGSAVVEQEITPADESCESEQALLKITIPEGCTEASIWVQYQGTPTGWTINLGDSPGNNGFGGDSGEADSEAELQILDETLGVYSNALVPGIVDLLAQAELRLTDGALQIVARDQYVSWGQSFSWLDTANSGLLYALPDAGAATEDQNTIYLGVNRVVSGPGDRTGCGVRRVLISFR